VSDSDNHAPAIKGFGVKNQNRSILRKPVSGRYKNVDWEIVCEDKGLFSWKAGALNGFTTRNSTLRVAVKEVKDSIDFQDDLIAHYGYITEDQVDMLERLKRWERMAASSKLSIKMKRRSNGTPYYVVAELT